MNAEPPADESASGMAPEGPSGPTPSGRRMSVLAVAALLLALASVVLWLYTMIPAMILGAAALVAIKRQPERLRGAPMAFVALILAPMLAIVAHFVVIPGLFRREGYGRGIDCMDNLRNLNLALLHYCVRSEDQMPPADQNTCLSLGVLMGDATDEDAGGQHWRCPSDRLIPVQQGQFWCSYAPNAGVEETDEVIGCFSSNSRLSNKIGDIAPNTISLIEMWTPPEVVPGHPGFLLKLDRTKPENWTRSMVEPGKELCAIRSYRTPRPVKFGRRGRLVDCGNYLFLRAFVGKRLGEMYHKGRINVAYIDGHVESKWVKDLIASDRPADNPEWTRAKD